MKKLLALLLVLCMVVGLIACGKPAENPAGGTTGNSANNNNNEENDEPRETVALREDVSDMGADVGLDTTKVPDSNDEFINPEKFAGKSIQIYGCDSIVFDDIENMGKGSFLWMMRAAIDEWATLNQVEVTYDGGLNTNDILAAINSGDKPDLMLEVLEAPLYFYTGITRGFTEDEYKQLADIAGARYLDVLKYKGECHGMMFPWSGNSFCYYNRTMFENYGVKSPKEYFMEDNWNWDTFEDCMESVTKDKNGNGKIDGEDTYGCSSIVYFGLGCGVEEDPETGKLTGMIGTSEQYKRYLEMRYRGVNETLSVLPGSTIQTCKIATTPRPAMYTGDCEWYNFEHLYEEIVNGDIIEVVPVPAFSPETATTGYTTQYMSIMSSCDEPEAVMSLISYMLKVGMRYMSDFSVGLYECTYEGMRGASEYSKAWKENFADICADRREAFAEIEDWDQECYEKTVKEIFSRTPKGGRRYPGDNNTEAGDTSAMPPASAIPLLAAAQEGWIAKYNSLYAN